MDDELRLPINIRNRIQYYLVDWAERQGFGWISMDMQHFPLFNLSMTVKLMKYPNIEWRLSVTSRELGLIIGGRIMPEREIFEELLPKKALALLRDIERIQNAEEELENQQQTLNH